MRRVRTHIVPVIGRLMLGLLVLFPLGPHTLTGLLLCIEAGGRIHVESIAESDCNSHGLLSQWEAHPVYPFAASSLTAQWQQVDKDLPIPCIDIPLLFSPTDGHGQSVPGQAVVQVATVGMLWIPWHLISNPMPGFHLTNLSAPSLRFSDPLRTVILRL